MAERPNGVEAHRGATQQHPLPEAAFRPTRGHHRARFAGFVLLPCIAAYMILEMPYNEEEQTTVFTSVRKQYRQLKRRFWKMDS